MNKLIILGLALLISIVSVNAFIGQGDTITIGVVSDTEMPVINISQNNLTLDSSTYWSPTGRISSDNINFILGTLEPDFVDLTIPQIENIMITPIIAYLDQNITLSAESYDTMGVAEEWVNITFPDSSSILNSTPYPFNFTVTQEGEYNITFYAVDTSYNLKSITHTLKVLNPTPFLVNISSKDSNASISLSHGSSTLQPEEFTGNLSTILPDTNYSLTITGLSDFLTINYKEINISEISSIELSYDKYENYVGYDNIYYVDLNHSSYIEINLTYTNIQNEDYLSFYICRDWNKNSSECLVTWEKISPEQDKINDRMSILLDSINTSLAFAIKQESFCGDGVCDSNENCNTCPQDCGVCPSSSSDSRVLPPRETESDDEPHQPHQPQQPQEIIEDDDQRSQRVFYSSISSDSAIDIDLSRSKSTIRRLSASVNEDFENVNFEIRSLVEEELEQYMIDALNNQISNAVVYDYVIISYDNLNSTKVSESEFTFAVSETWFKENQFRNDQLAIYKYVDLEWVDKDISSIANEDDFILLTIKTSGLSLFSIAGLKDEEIISEEVLDEDYDDYDDISETSYAIALNNFIIMLILGLLFGVVLSYNLYNHSKKIQYNSYKKMVSDIDLSISKNNDSFSFKKLSKIYPEELVKERFEKHKIETISYVIQKYNLRQVLSTYNQISRVLNIIRHNENIDFKLLIDELIKLGWDSYLVNVVIENFYDPLILEDKLLENNDDPFRQIYKLK